MHAVWVKEARIEYRCSRKIHRHFWKCSLHLITYGQKINNILQASEEQYILITYSGFIESFQETCKKSGSSASKKASLHFVEQTPKPGVL